MNPAVPVCTKLKRARVQGRVIASGVLAGDSPMRVKGLGLEYEDLRQYVYGDDSRYIDWRASARTGLERLYVKEFRAERESRLLWLVDLTASMGFKDKLESLVLVLTLHAEASARLRDRVSAVVVSDRVETYEYTSSRLLLERLLRQACRGARGGLSLGEALRAASSFGRGAYWAVYTDLSNKPEEYARLLEASRALGRGALYFLFTREADVSRIAETALVAAADRESGSTGMVELAEAARQARRHIARVRAAVGRRAVELGSYEHAVERAPYVVEAYLRLRQGL
ncbi:DUF58 domain-containing protein [Infirmifilum sp. NZ]|uniref:DUF58 domain-containing protein n=1 Tax=Infirmifilum sp. NZ TaxID=2926850 RepID=UPI00279A4CC9|nr:DUF58 domain-containing protein [Infirmifilum sp. NZ]UNQ73439.1 DUF58 domain-containing protein [Infirmifilum sp. NZ]